MPFVPPEMYESGYLERMAFHNGIDLRPRHGSLRYGARPDFWDRDSVEITGSSMRIPRATSIGRRHGVRGDGRRECGEQIPATDVAASPVCVTNDVGTFALLFCEASAVFVG